jgi:hypothetical protein
MCGVPGLEDAIMVIIMLSNSQGKQASSKADAFPACTARCPQSAPCRGQYSMFAQRTACGWKVPCCSQVDVRHELLTQAIKCIRTCYHT